MTDPLAATDQPAALTMHCQNRVVTVSSSITILERWRLDIQLIRIVLGGASIEHRSQRAHGTFV